MVPARVVGVSLVASECFFQTVAGFEAVIKTVEVDRELGERDNMEEEVEPGITLFAVTEENGEHGNLDFDKFILTYTRRSKFEYDIK